jgi:hypothetical protein
LPRFIDRLFLLLVSSCSSNTSTKTTMADDNITMADDNNVPLVSAAAAAKATAAAKKKECIDASLSVATLKDVIWEGDKLIAIKDIKTANLTLDKLRQFCAKFLIYGYKSKSKDVICTLIVQRAKSTDLEDKTYPELAGNLLSDAAEADEESGGSESETDINTRFRDGDLTGVGSVQQVQTILTETKKERKKRKPKATAKSTAPPAVTTEGTYYRLLNVYFDEKHRPDVAQLGANPTLAVIDAREFKHKAVYDKLLDTYQSTDDALQHIGQFAFKENHFFESSGVSLTCTEDFDQLESADVKSAMEYLNFHYQDAFRKFKLSGNHDDFEKFVGTRPYLFYYHLWLVQVPGFHNLAVATLPSNVFRDSGGSRESGGSGSSASPLTVDTPAKKRGKRGEDHRAGMSAAMLAIGAAGADKVLLLKERNEQHASAALLQKEQHSIALERHCIALERELSGVVQEHSEQLCKWEDILQDLIDRGIGVENTRVKTANTMVAMWNDKLATAIATFKKNDISIKTSRAE